VTGPFATTSVEATRDLGTALAGLCGPGDLLVLAGEMGAGKTALTQGLARGLGVPDQVTSPTFTLLRHHEGRLPLHHVDVYRLGRLHEVQDLGLPELLDGPGVTVIEWGDMVAEMLPTDYLEVRVSYGDGDDDRLLELRAVGPSWSARQRALAEALEAWRC
jgi:tRNA threonylcarbamoyladenosine biosynthesis protein TsaE